MAKYALIGFGISLACMIPPGIHFVTGPLGPVIGGFFAGNKHKAHPDQALGIGVLMGLFMVLPVGIVLAVDKLAPSLNSWIDSDILTIAGLIVLSYTVLMGSLGAIVGGYIATRTPNQDYIPTNK